MAAGAGCAETGIAFLERVADQTPALAPLVRAEAAILCLRANLDEKALDLAQRQDGQAGSTMDAALNGARLRLARLLSMPGNNAKLEAASRLVALVRLTAADDPVALLVEARVRALKTPPEYETARELVGQVLAVDPLNAEAVLLLSQIDFAQGRVAEALDGARTAAGLSPGNPDVLLFKAEIEQASNLPSDARATLRSIVAQHPENLAAALKLFDNYLSAGYVTEAGTMLDHIDKERPSDSTVDLDELRGRLARATGQRAPESLQTVRETYRAQPDMDHLRELIAALKARGDRAETEQTLAVATAGPLGTSPEPWALLAECYLDEDGAESTRKASAAVTRALLIDPQNPSAMRTAVRLFLRENNPDGALSMCERYLKAEPNDPGMLSQQAVLLTRAGRPQEALHAAERSLRVVQRPPAVFVRAGALLALGRYKEALTDLQQTTNAEQIDPADHDAAMAEAYAGLKNEELARRYFVLAKDKFQAAQRPLTEQMKRLASLFERRP